MSKNNNMAAVCRNSLVIYDFIHIDLAMNHITKNHLQKVAGTPRHCVFVRGFQPIPSFSLWCSGSKNRANRDISEGNLMPCFSVQQHF